DRVGIPAKPIDPRCNISDIALQDWILTIGRGHLCQTPLHDCQGVVFHGQLHIRRGHRYAAGEGADDVAPVTIPPPWIIYYRFGGHLSWGCGCGFAADARRVETRRTTIVYS